MSEAVDIERAEQKAEQARKILFRAKVVGDLRSFVLIKEEGEFVYGHYAEIYDEYDERKKSIIIPCDAKDILYEGLEYYEIVFETLGQYTGLKDKNGKMIFEGDIVDIDDNRYERGVIEWDKDELMYMINENNCCSSFTNFSSGQLEVIGNIHDNPQLMEIEK